MPRRSKAPRNDRGKHWCFTLNNPATGECVFDDKNLAYLIVGNEVAPGTKTPHLQGYAVFKIRRRLGGVKLYLPRAHWELKRGTNEEARDYCKKDNDWVEYGIFPKRQQEIARITMKAAWDEAYLLAKRQALESIPKNMLIRYYAAFKRIAQDNPVIPAILPEKKNLWIVAPSGYGKSTYARDKYPDFYDKAPNKWWVGYEDQPAVICDDYGPKQCEHLGWYMKRWADNFPFPMETKGGGKMIRPEHIIVTSQYTIGACFFDPLTREAIENRFKVLNLERWEVRELITDEVLDEMSFTGTTEEYDSDESVELEVIGRLRQDAVMQSIVSGNIIKD